MAQPAHATDLHPTTRYAVDVDEGRIVTGKPVLWACRRHLDDLEHGEKRAGLWFDEEMADRLFRFFHQIPFVKGERAGEPFDLELWQQFVVGSIFGWMRADGFRRFREAWVRVARGNGKSPLGSGSGNYCTGWDGHYTTDGAWHPEQEAQVFSSATKRAQARIIHGTALRQRELSPYLSAHLTTRRDRIIHQPTNSFFEPLGRDAKTEDGWDPLCAIFDEVHAYAGREMWDVMESAMVKRRQALILAFTTAGFGALGFAVQQDDYYRRIVDPMSGTTNDSAFVYIAELDPKVRCGTCAGQGKTLDGQPCKRCAGRGFNGDDPYDEANWIKANPNLGVSVYLSGMRDLAAKAKQDRRSEANFFVKNLNRWQQAEDRAIDLDTWDECGRLCPMPPEEELRRRPCFGGLDLSSNRDLTALDIYWPACGPWKTAAVRAWFWIPEDTVPLRKKWESLDYLPWIEAGEVITTPGEFVNQDYVRRKVNELASIYPLKRLGCDRKFGEKLLPELEGDGFEVDRVAQSFGNLCVPWQEFERMVGTMALAHGGHGVLRAHAEHVVLARDVDGLVMPSKGKSGRKIDGIAALLNAIYLARITPYEATPAPFEHRTLPKGRGGGKRAIFNVFNTR